MTGAVGILLALAAGWLVTGRKRVALVVVLPFLVVLGFQTWGIGSGRGVSPPNTVRQAGYYIVQVIILAAILGIAEMLRLRRARTSDRPTAPGYGGPETRLGLLVNGVLVAVVVLLFQLDHSFFDPGSVAHHRSNGSPPIVGAVGIILTLVAVVGLGLLTLKDRRGSVSQVSPHQQRSDAIGQTH